MKIRNRPEIFTELKNQFGDKLIFDFENYNAYLKDASELTAIPDALFFAENESEVVAIIDYGRRRNIPIVFRGAGTGYTGGAVPMPNCLILSLEKLKKLQIFPDKKLALCGPGVITKELMDSALAHYLYYPPDPASYEESTLGGNVAECAGGLHCKKYGVTKDYIIGLRAITVDGRIIETGIYAKNEVFDLSLLLTGSEGLLAAITEIAVRLIEPPVFGPLILAAFENPENGARTVSKIVRHGIIPSVMEYIDRSAAACSNEYEKTLDIENAGVVLLMETSGDNCRSEASKIEHICQEENAILLIREDNKTQAAALWSIRRNLSKAVKAAAKHKISEDVAVPPSRLPELVAHVAELNRTLPIRVNSYGHAGDGNLHVNFLAETGSADELKMIDSAIKELFRKTLDLGGSISGEHGIGLTKKEYLAMEFNSATLNKMKQVKTVFDPNSIFNPGKMFS